MKDQHEEIVAIFKPNSEERFCRGKENQGCKADREVAAFLLDHPVLFEEKEGIGRVPPTAIVRAKYFHGETTKEWEKGSLQQYIPNQWNRKEEVFAVDDVQRLSLIDIRFGNNDRHKGNILYSNLNEAHLIPIDHGECFPMEWNNYKFGWTNWSQANVPYPSYMAEYVKSLDVETDLKILEENGIELGAKSVFAYKIQNEVLKVGVLGGYSARDIGKFMEKVYSSKREKKDYGSKREETIIDVMGSCMGSQPEAGSEEETELLKLIHERIKIALDNNKRLPDEKASTSSRRGW